MVIKYENKYIRDAIIWLNSMYPYSVAPDVKVSVINGYQSLTGDGEKFGFAVYIPKGKVEDCACIQLAGDLPDELEEYCSRVEDRESVERDFFVGNLFHELAHHFQFTDFRLVSDDDMEIDAEEFSRNLYATYENELRTADVFSAVGEIGVISPSVLENVIDRVEKAST